MKTRIFRSVAALALVCILAFSLTGCDKLDYRKAVSLYNSRQYDAAAERFYELGDYEDSSALFTRSQYWAAVSLAEQGHFHEALPRFLKLGSYEDSAQWATECKYRMAIAAFEEGNLTDAENIFRDNPGYKQAEEYLRQITWQKFFDAVAAAGTESGGSFTLQKETDGKVYSISADLAEPNQLIFFVSSAKDVGYVFYDDLTFTLTRDSTEAAFTAESTFSMDYNGMQIGSRQEASGKLDITTCTAETVLVPELFEKTVTDNHGKTTVSLNPAHIRMSDTMADNLRALLTVIPELLAESGIALTLADIGFYAL